MPLLVFENLAEDKLMSNLQLFNFEDHKVRFVGTADRPEWAALDVVSILHPHSSPNNRVNYLRSIPEKWKGHKKIMTPGGEQEVVTLLEPGLYRMLARTNSPIAEPFQDWLFEEVLPAIRKQGFYLSPDATAAQLENAMQTIEQQQARIAQLESECKALRESERQQTKAKVTAQIAERINELETLQCKEWREWDDRTALGRLVKEFICYLRELNIAAHEDRISTEAAQTWMDKAEELFDRSVTEIKKLPPDLPGWQSLHLYIPDWKNFRLQSIDNPVIWRQSAVTAN